MAPRETPSDLHGYPQRDPLERDLAKVGTLWHYTGKKALESILEHRTLWATRADCMNDSSEIHHASGYLQQAWDGAAALSQQGGGLPGLNTLVRVFALSKMGPEVPVQVVLKDGPMPYVTCFCGEVELLSMWRNYAGGEGYAIGFSAQDLHKLSERLRGQLAAVHYADPWDPPNVTGTPDPVTGRLEVSPMQAAEIKHPGFVEEREYRVIVPGDTDLPVKHRGDQTHAPYVELPLADCGPVAVWAGPGMTRNDIDGLKGLLAEHGWSDVLVGASDIPLRRER